MAISAQSLETVHQAKRRVKKEENRRLCYIKTLIHDTDISAQRTVVGIWKELQTTNYKQQIHLFMILAKEIFSCICFFNNLVFLFMIPADYTAKCFSWCEIW